MMSQTQHRRFWDSTFWGSRFMVDFSASLVRLKECKCFLITDLPKSSMYGLFTYIWLKSMLFLRWCFSKNSGFPRQALVIFSRINVGKGSYRGKSQNPNFQPQWSFQTAIARVLRRKSRHFFLRDTPHYILIYSIPSILPGTKWQVWRHISRLEDWTKTCPTKICSNFLLWITLVALRG